MTVTGRAAALDDVLTALLQQTPGLEAAAVVSFDGLPMASALPADLDESRVAAMSAALLSLGERAAEGLGRGPLSQVYVEGADGTVFLVSADGAAVLVAVGAVGAKAGLVLYELRRAAAALGRALREPTAGPAPAVPDMPLAPPGPRAAESPQPGPAVVAPVANPDLLPGWPLVGPAPVATSWV